MNEITTSGIICLKDGYNFEYQISEIDYIEYDNNEYKYLFYPYYNVINLLNSKLFQGIPGLDLDLKLKCYERKNITPVFISERTPSKNRVDLYELLDKYNMKSLNRLEWLIRTDMKYFGDNFYVIRKENNNQTIKVNSMFDLVKRFDSIHKELLKIICLGQNLDCNEITINDENRKYYYDLLMPIYIKQYNYKINQINQGINKAKDNNIYKGRKRILIDPLLFEQIIKDYKDNKISIEEVIKTLNISKSTFFRRLKNYNN